MSTKIVARTLVERLARGKKLKRRLPAQFKSTPLYVSPDSQLKYLKPGAASFDAELLEVAKRYVKPDSVVWDVGANIGVFAFAAASLTTQGSVLAIEADIWLAQLIKQSAALPKNRGLKIQVIPTAVSQSNGVATFFIAKRGRASNYLEGAGARSQTGGVRDKVLVPTLTLDTLLEAFAAPTFIKIDVEGAEDAVLKGASRLLKEVRPTFYIEVGSATQDEVTQIFLDHDYLLFDGATRAPIEQCAFNTIAIPREKTD